MKIDMLMSLLEIIFNNYRLLVIIVFWLIWFLLIIKKKNITNKLLIQWLSYVFIIFFVSLIWILTFFDYKNQQDYIKNMPFILQKDSCNFEYTGTYKYLDLYDVEYITPKQKPKVNEYTKKISISGEVQEVKVCILADVRDDHKVPGYSFYVYTYLWSDIHRGYLNVWRYKESQQLFDRDVWWRNQELYGRFNGDETPFRQVIDLERVIFADTQGDEYYKYTRPIVNFQKTWAINVWAYVEWDSHWYAWKILQFRIIYKWGLIEIK